MTRRLALAGLCLLHALTASQAATIYNTFGSDPSARGEFPSYYIAGWYYSVASDTGSGLNYASPFSFSGSAYQLTSITLDIGLNTFEGPLGPNFQIGISYDNGGVPAANPFAVIEPSSTFVTPDGIRHLTTFNFSGQSILSPETTYWLTIGPRVVGVHSADYNGDYTISTSPFGTAAMARRDFNGAWADWAVYPNSREPLFTLDGVTVVPEPSTWALLALGGVAFAWAARRRHKR